MLNLSNCCVHYSWIGTDMASERAEQGLGKHPRACIQAQVKRTRPSATFHLCFVGREDELVLRASPFADRGLKTGYHAIPYAHAPWGMYESVNRHNTHQRRQRCVHLA